jgi:hypothetical protein
MSTAEELAKKLKLRKLTPEELAERDRQEEEGKPKLKLRKLSELTPKQLELYYRKQALWRDPVRRKRAIESVYLASKRELELEEWRRSRG